MLTQIDVMSDNAFEMPILGVTPKNSFLIKKVAGLNPPDRSLFIGDYSQDGGLYQGRRVGSRNVVLTIDLNPNPALGETVSSLREKLYKAFIDPQVNGDYLKILLTDDDNNERYLVGYCEKFETEIFDAETMCQISMICPDPYLRRNEDTVLYNGTGWVQVPFAYEGTAETGFIARIYVTTPNSMIALRNNNKVMYFESSYEVGDVLIVNTIPGQRSLSLTKLGDLSDSPTDFDLSHGYNYGYYVYYGKGVWQCVTTELEFGVTIDDAPGNNNDYWEFVSTPVMSHLTPNSQWLQLHNADNVMRVYGGTNPDSIVANIQHVRYTAAYWGV